MNKIKEYINKLTKNQKKMIIGAISLFLLAIITIGIGVSYSSTESGYLSDQTVEGLTFENAKLVYENGISTYTVEVVNDLEEDYNLNNINIIFKDGDGNEIVSLLGYIGNKLAVGETKIIDASIDQEITDITSIEYVINK